MNTMKKWIPLTLPLWLFSFAVHSQSYSIDWDVIAGGGGVTSGGGFSANSTIGEHVAGGSSASNAVVLAWPASATSWTLQQNTDLVAVTWISLTNGVNSVSGQNQVILPAPSGNRFYRLKSP